MVESLVEMGAWIPKASTNILTLQSPVEGPCLSSAMGEEITKSHQTWQPATGGCGPGQRPMTMASKSD